MDDPRNSSGGGAVSPLAGLNGELRSDLAARMIEAAPGGVLLVDRRGRIVYANQGAADVFGWARDELVGRQVDVLVPEPHRGRHAEIRERYFATPPGKRNVGVEVAAIRKNGTKVFIDVRLSQVLEGEEPLVLTVVRDVTDEVERKHRLEEYARGVELANTSCADLQHELEASNELLRQRNKELEQFAFVASHDLQEPLRKIVAFGDRLKVKYAPQLDAQGRDYIERMQSAGMRMQALIDDLLAYSRLTTRAQPFERVDLGRVVKNVLSDMEVALERSYGSVDVAPLPIVDADPVQMRQVFQNLIGNALKYAREGVPPAIRVYSVLATGPGDHEMASVYVQDNGIGFDEQYLDRIFTVFERLHPHDAYEGTGIGLAICEKIVRRHGGTITARSKPGHGSTFVFTVPIAAHGGREQAS